jgi:hypothetical protein
MLSSVVTRSDRSLGLAASLSIFWNMPVISLPMPVSVSFSAPSMSVIQRRRAVELVSAVPVWRTAASR